MPFLFFHLHGIDMFIEVYGLTLNQDILELCLVQLVNCWKIRKDEGWVPRFIFFWKNNFFRLFSKTWVKRHFSIEIPIPYFH